MSSTDRDIVYTGRDGDRLDSLAYVYYGDENLEERILEENPSLLRRKDFFLKAGEQVTLPRVEDSQVDVSFVDVFS